MVKQLQMNVRSTATSVTNPLHGHMFSQNGVMDYLEKYNAEISMYMCTTGILLIFSHSYAIILYQRRYEIINISRDFHAYQCVSLWTRPHTVAM